LRVFFRGRRKEEGGRRYVCCGVGVGEVKNSLLVLEAFEGGGFELVDDEGEALLDEGRAGVLATATADDVKALAGSRESDVEQIEIVDGVLQVLV
jgi:hypothetical protein